MNTGLFLNNLYNNFINKQIKTEDNIKSLEEVLCNLDKKCLNIVNEILNDKNNFRNKNFVKIGKTSIFTQEQRVEFRENNRPFKDFCTDIVNDQIISYTGFYNFMYIIWKVHSSCLTLYRDYYNIDSNDIIFIYKGGNFLSKMAKKFWTSLPGHAVQYLITSYREFFKRSDMDYSIYINPNLDNYDKIFKDINHLSFKIQDLIRDIFISNKYISFHWFKYNSEYKKFLLDDYLKKLKTEESVTTDPENNSYYTDEIIDFIFDNVSAYKENTDYKIRNDQILEYKDNNVERNDIYTPNKSFCYITFNEALSFHENTALIHFNLIRTKVNFNIKFKKNNISRIENIGGELIDVSIPHKDDSNIEHFFQDIKSHVNKITYQQPCIKTSYYVFYNYETEFKQKTYSLEYVYYDLYRMLFKKHFYPWLDKKYKKRIYRLFYLSHIDFFSSNIILNENQVNIKRNKFIKINNYILEYKKYIYENQDSIYYLFKSNNKDVKLLKLNINAISKLLCKKEEILDYSKYDNKLIVRNLRATIKIIIKVLYNYNLINLNIYNTDIDIEKSEETDSILNCIEKLITFIDYVIHNMRIIFETMNKIQEFCKDKTIDGNILNKYEFPAF